MSGLNLQLLQYLCQATPGSPSPACGRVGHGEARREGPRGRKPGGEGLNPMTASTERIDPARTALIAYDVCKRILTPADPAARERMRPALESWRR